jgi:hypothetical protein
MKKLFFIITILCCFGFVFSQNNKHKNNNGAKENTGRKALFGIYFGPTVDWFAPTSDSLKRDAAKMGFKGGFNVDIRLTDNNVVFFSTGVQFRYLQGDVRFNNEYRINILDTSLITSTVRTYQTYYLASPTGVKFKIKVADRWALLGQLGLYHNFKIGGNQFDNFEMDEKYFITTKKIKNEDAARFAESCYFGLGFEYMFEKNTGVFAHIDYGCQFNYFNAKAKSNVLDKRFKTVVHSLHVTVGFMF